MAKPQDLKGMRKHVDTFPLREEEDKESQRMSPLQINTDSSAPNRYQNNSGGRMSN